MRDILPVIQSLLSQSCNMHPEAVTPETDIRGLSFLAMAHLLMGCEKAFHIVLQDEWALEFTCVADVIFRIEQERKDGRADYAAPTEREREAWKTY